MISGSAVKPHSSLKEFWTKDSSFSRAIYETNTLAEVIFQARFGRILKIDAELPVQFQEAVAKTHPILEVEEGFQVNFAANQTPAAIPIKTYKFFSNDRSSFISLNSSFVAVTTTRYTDWERLRTDISLAMKAAQSVYSVSAITRIGLRYLNVINRSTLGFQDRPWSALLKPCALGWIANEFCEKWVKRTQTEVLFSCDPISCQVRSGLITNDGSPELAFLLDADYFIESMQTAEINDILSLADELHNHSGPFFRWCITDELHAALVPRSVD